MFTTASCWLVLLFVVTSTSVAVTEMSGCKDDLDGQYDSLLMQFRDASDATGHAVCIGLMIILMQ